MRRRVFLGTAAGGVIAGATARSFAAAPSSGAQVPFPSLIDTNVTLGNWVVRRSWAESAEAMVAKFRRHGVTAAWAGSVDAVLHSDVAGVNARLADACQREGGGVLLPFGTVNPTLPDWEDDVRRCTETHRMRGIRLFPSYHGYTLDDPRFKQLVDLAAKRGLLIQIAVTIEDERSQNPVLTSAPVNVAPLVDVATAQPRARIMLLNATSRLLGAGNPLLQRLAAAGVWFEISTLEGVAGIATLLTAFPPLRLAFGSHSPYFYFESAWLKLRESELSAAQLAAVGHEHALAALDEHANSQTAR